MPTAWDTSHGYPYQPLPGATAQQEVNYSVPSAVGVSSTPPDYWRSYIIYDRPYTAQFNPFRARPVEAARKRCIVRNIGAIPVQVQYGTGTNANFNNPGFGAGTVTLPAGTEAEFFGGSQQIFIRQQNSGDLGLRVGIYTEMSKI